MKKFYSFLVAAAMVLGATSCANNDTTEEILPAEGAISFVGELAASRTELGEGNKVMWNADDKIRIYTQENTAGASFAGAATEATPTTTFTTTEAFATSNTGYFAVYSDKTYFNENWSNDWSAKEASYNNGVWSVPVKMQGAQYEGLYIPKDSYLEENNFMVAYSEDNKLSFKAATAMIKFVHTGAETWGSFRATGADLTGAATLNYNTATGEISYTTEGDETYIDFEATEAGQTCYLPIYPGTVNGFELYDGQTLIAKYDGEITFKAGVIYNMDIENMPALPVVSPYSMMNMATYERIPMEVKDGYHVAKNVPFSEMGYVVSEGWDQLYSVKTTDFAPVAMSQWHTTSLYYEIEQFMMFESAMADVYMTEDCSKICFVPAGVSPFVATEWSLVGAFNEWGAAGADIQFYTTPTDNLYVAKEVELQAYSEWKIRKNKAWTTTFGGGYKYNLPNKYVTVYDNGSNVSVIADGVYDIYFEYSGSGTTAKLYIVSAGEAYTTATEQTEDGPKQNPEDVTFGIVGNHNGWGNDNVMTYDEALNTYVCKSVALNGNFKIRGNKDWNSGYNIGALSTSNVTVGKGMQVQNNGNSGNLNVAKGTYDVYYSYAKDMLWVMNVGDVPTDL